MTFVQPRPELVWGLLSRGIGLVYLVSFASLSAQVLPIAGRDGITPIANSLAAIERDFPTWKRFAYFPTLLWLNRSDGIVRMLPFLGMASAASVVVGGWHVPVAFAVCYVTYLSLDRAIVLVYPWDCVLFEAGLFGIFLPATHPLPELAAVHAPMPLVAWVYRLLVFRVMLGFGKHKFLGSTSRDAGFLKSFFVQQPLPTILGWHAQKLPLPMLKLALVGTFLVEVFVPFAVFLPGAPSTVAAVLTITLMIFIQVTGNFGYFNLVMIVLALSWLDGRTAASFRWASLAEPGTLQCVAILHGLVASFAFPFNTFCAHTWMNWSPWTRLKNRWLTIPAWFSRALHPFRIAHAYGVFPPQSPPPVRFAPAIEVSWDGRAWHTLTHRYAPVLATSPPVWCAPHHERFDQAVVYEAIGLNEVSLYRNIVGRWDPYGYGGESGAHVLLRRIVAGTVPGERFFDGTLIRARGAPKHARVRLYMLEPVSQQRRRASAHFWHRTLVGPHFPAISSADAAIDEPLPAPEQWHPDDVVWLKRSRLGAMMRRALRGEDPHALVVEGAPDDEPQYVERFWSELLPAANAGDCQEFSDLRTLQRDLRARYGHAAFLRLERISGRYAALLFARLEPLFLERGILPVFGAVKPTLDVDSHYHMRLLANHVVKRGKLEYDAVFGEPRRAIEHAARMTLGSGLFLPALFRYEAFVYQSQKARLLEAYTDIGGRVAPTLAQQRAKQRIDALLRRAFGAIAALDFLKTRFQGEQHQLDVKERWPRFAFNEQSEIVRVSRYETDEIP